MFHRLIQKIKSRVFNDKKEAVDSFLWDQYAKNWDKENIHIENKLVSRKDRSSYLKYLGDEWGRVDDVKEIIDLFIVPFINQRSVVGEIGIGGGRVAVRIPKKVKEFYGFDISPEMLKIAKKNIKKNNSKFYLLKNQKFPNKINNKFDFIYSFDVFVHLPTRIIWNYFISVNKILKPNGKFFVHTANILTEAGWKNFSSKQKYFPHVYLTPEIVKLMAKRSGYKLIKESKGRSKNFYLKRDYLAVFEKANRRNEDKN